MRLQPDASAVWAAQFIPVTGEQRGIASPPLSPPHWHCHKLAAQSICECNDLCKSNPSMCTQKKSPCLLPAVLQQDVGARSDLHIGHPFCPCDLLRWWWPHPSHRLSHTRQTQMSPAESLRALRKIEKHSVGHCQTIQTDTNELLIQATGTGQHMSYLAPVWYTGMQAEQAKPHLPTGSPWLQRWKHLKSNSQPSFLCWHYYFPQSITETAQQKKTHNSFRQLQYEFGSFIYFSKKTVSSLHYIR